ncbi:AP2/ERF and B3 domain-containing transcription factor At1g50680-like [Telopea speciosissima]|uniref:AP2/ERF and B3 domain-containing transcription factor At1g50680-like n=1 Tax=Telopea speciosissima TaxID=54955 RepID=UPI001CC81061|nr:AP2/ERF and B3 domain-containing transcription factor At1g50680-like [Telopea speciosissima]
MEEMISTISNGLRITNVNNIGERSDSNSTTNPPSLARRTRQRNENPSSSSYPRFKGVVMQQNGHWGAQIYANHQRIWLGTFKTENEAAMAYDSAAIILRKDDSHRNLPWNAITVQEPNFQNLHTNEAILGMIKDGSYQSKFMDFMMTQYIGNNYNITTGTNRRSQRNEQGILYHELFQKELTPSDVGKLNRLVIPKKQAIAYFPETHVEVIGTEEHRDDNHLYLTFFDNQNKPWSFRYCYWKSSQSYVFTKGWNRFVKVKDLKANDIITFYSCDYRNIHSGELHTYFMIETKSKNTNDGHGGGSSNYLELQHGLEQGMIRREEIVNKGIRLFGINIIG